MPTTTHLPTAPSAENEPESGPDLDLFRGRDPFIPRDAFLSNKGCPRFTGIPALPVPCANCPAGRCWFIESQVMRKAGLPALTPRDWRVLVKATSPEDDGADEDDDLDGGFEIEG